MLIDNNAVRVAAVGHTSGTRVGRIKRQLALWTDVFTPGLTLLARTVRIHKAPDGRQISWLELCDRGSDPGHAANDLMSGHNRELDRGAESWFLSAAPCHVPLRMLCVVHGV